VSRKNTSRSDREGRKGRRGRPAAGRLQTARRFGVKEAPGAFASDDIRHLRTNVLKVSQRLFAGLLNVAVQTVHAWEQGGRKPSGVALRLLHVAQDRPDILTCLVGSRNGNGRNRNHSSQKRSDR